MRKAAVLFLLLALIACGGGGGGSDPQAAGPTWTGPVNAAGYPDVAGAYSFNVAAGNAVCTDGASQSEPPLAMNLDVSQTDNQILLKNSSPSSLTAGTTILQKDNLAGNVDLHGSFTVNQHISATFTGTPGNNSINYTTTGIFNPTGWSGTYQFTLYNDYYKQSCTYTAAFQGDKISKTVSKAQAKNAEDNPVWLEGVGSLFGLSTD